MASAIVWLILGTHPPLPEGAGWKGECHPQYPNNRVYISLLINRGEILQQIHLYLPLRYLERAHTGQRQPSAQHYWQSPTERLQSSGRWPSRKPDVFTGPDTLPFAFRQQSDRKACRKSLRLALNAAGQLHLLHMPVPVQGKHIISSFWTSKGEERMLCPEK